MNNKDRIEVLKSALVDNEYLQNKLEQLETHGDLNELGKAGIKMSLEASRRVEGLLLGVKSVVSFDEEDEEDDEDEDWGDDWKEDMKTAKAFRQAAEAKKAKGRPGRKEGEGERPRSMRNVPRGQKGKRGCAQLVRSNWGTIERMLSNGGNATQVAKYLESIDPECNTSDQTVRTYINKKGWWKNHSIGRYVYDQGRTTPFPRKKQEKKQP